MAALDVHEQEFLTQQDRRQALDDALPKITRTLVTYSTGLPADGERVMRRTQTGRILGAFGAYLGGVGLGALIAGLSPASTIALLPLALTMAVGGARHLQLTIYHHAAHGTVISKNVSERLGRLIASALVIEPFESYAPKHRTDHHGRQTVSTELDPTLVFLRDVIGIVPGDTVERNRKRFRKALVSPRLHMSMLVDRLKAQFGPDASWTNRLRTAICLSALTAGTYALGGVSGVGLGFLLPMTVGYQAAQIARLMVEHRWPSDMPVNGKRTVADHDELTLAVRLAPLPPRNWTVANTARFVSSSLANLWLRFVVLPGDSGPSHHWHHGFARGDWANHVLAAQAWTIEHRAKGNPGPEDAWGYGEALDRVLQSFAAADIGSIQPPRRARNR